MTIIVIIIIIINRHCTAIKIHLKSDKNYQKNIVCVSEIIHIKVLGSGIISTLILYIVSTHNIKSLNKQTFVKETLSNFAKKYFGFINSVKK